MTHVFRLLLVTGLLSACSKDDRITVVVYSPHGPDIGKEFEKAFETENPGVDVQYQPLPTADILTRVRGESANPSCDVWWGAPSSTFAIAADEALLEPYRPDWLAHVDEKFHDREDRFAPHFTIPQVIVYNRDRRSADDAPTSWDDLASDAYAGRVVMRNPPPSGSMRGAFSWLVAWKAGNDPANTKAGFDYLRAVHRNTKSYGAIPKELFEAIKRDKDDVVGVWNLADAIFQRDRYEYPFGIAIPAEGVPVVIDCIALVKNDRRSPARAEAAKKYYDFVTSIESGRKLMNGHGRILIRGDVPAEDLPSWHAEYAYEPLPVDATFAATNADAWMSEWEAKVKPLEHGGS